MLSRNLIKEENLALRDEILELKKAQNAFLRENEWLRTKIFKLERELKRKEKHIANVVDPKNLFNIRKLVADKGTSILINLRDQNRHLERSIMEKDRIMQSLQNDLKTFLSYGLDTSARRKQAAERLHELLQEYVKSLERMGINMPANVELSRETEYFLNQNDQQLETKIMRYVHHRKKNMNDYRVTLTGPLADYSKERLIEIITQLKEDRKAVICGKGNVACNGARDNLADLEHYFDNVFAEVDNLRSKVATLKDIRGECNCMGLVETDTEVEITMDQDAISKKTLPPDTSEEDEPPVRDYGAADHDFDTYDQSEEYRFDDRGAGTNADEDMSITETLQTKPSEVR